MKTHRTLTRATIAGALLLASTTTGREAQAAGPVSGDGKGIVGGVLLGGELVGLGLGIAGVEPAWPYLVFCTAGALGGGIAGWAVEGSGAPAEAPVYMLAGGLTLIVPTLVVVLNATAYRPPNDESTEPIDNEPGEVPPAEPGRPFGQAPTTEPSAAARVPALVGLSPGQLSVGAPAIAIRPLYTPDEVVRYGVEQGTEVHVPLFGARF